MPRPTHRRRTTWSSRSYVGAALLLALSACRPIETQAPTQPALENEPAPLDPELQARLAWMEAQLEAARISTHVAGMSVAVVRGDELIYAKGFGLRDVKAGLPATPETRFAIGSTTKAFSAALVAMIVDEGKVDWDDPVTKHLPEFQLSIRSDEAGQAPTLRDLLSHATGFARMGLLWAGGTIPRDEVFAYASKAEPVADFRESFHYNNVTYMAAAEAAARAAGSSWESLVRERIFEPLGMKDSSTDFASAKADEQMAQGYTWRPDLDRNEPMPMRNIDIIGPAGSINSSVLDMAKWLRLQLGDGIFEGERLVSKRELYQARRPLIQVAPGQVDYGMGWMIRTWGDRTIVEHGGNIDGFSASVALLPEEDLGVVLLTNASTTPLQQTGYMTVFKALLTDAYLEDPNPTGEELDRYAGRYRPPMPGFAGEFFEVVVNGSNLAVDVPGQSLFALTPPDDDGWREFQATSDISVSFEEDDSGRITALVLHQGGMSFEMPAEGYDRPPEVREEEVTNLLGHYESEKGVRGDIAVVDGRLTFDIYRQMPFALAPVESDGEYHFRANYEMFIVFDVEKKRGREKVVGLTLFDRGNTVKFTRGEARPLPTLEAIHAKRRSEQRRAAVEKAGVMHMRQDVDVRGAGLPGRNELWFDAKGELRQEVRYGAKDEVGEGTTVLHDGAGWMRSTFVPLRSVEGIQQLQLALGHPAVLLGDWRSAYTEEEVLRSTDEKRWRVRLRREGYPSVVFHVDVDTGDVVQVDGFEVSLTGVRFPVKTKISDYREVDGIRVPFRYETSNDESGRVIVTVESFETGLDTSEARFVPMPKE